MAATIGLHPTRRVSLERVDRMRLPVTSPFNFRCTVWKPSHFYTGLELHTPTASWRSFRIREAFCGVRMEMEDPLTLGVDVYCDQSWSAQLRGELAARLRYSYGLEEDLAPFLTAVGGDPALARPLERLAGMRMSCPESLFEVSIISLCLQNTTVARSAQMMGNILSHYGAVLAFDGTAVLCFPTPSEISAVDEMTFREVDRLGYRAKYLPRFAEFFSQEPPRSEMVSDELSASLQAVKGVGPYTAGVIASHAARDTAAFGLDVWNRKILGRRLLGREDAPADEVRAQCGQRFGRYQGLAVLYLVEDEYLDSPTAPLLPDAAAVRAAGAAILAAPDEGNGPAPQAAP